MLGGCLVRLRHDREHSRARLRPEAATVTQGECKETRAGDRDRTGGIGLGEQFYDVESLFLAPRQKS